MKPFYLDWKNDITAPMEIYRYFKIVRRKLRSQGKEKKIEKEKIMDF